MPAKSGSHRVARPASVRPERASTPPRRGTGFGGPPRTVVLLGSQRFDPSLGASVTKLRVEGRIALITAGWQERESEDEELSAPIGGNTINLRLHSRAEAVFRADPTFHAAHRERQELLRHKQDFYRIRLEHALEAARVIRQRAAPETTHEEEAASSIAALRELDARHLADCARLHREFEANWDVANRSAIAEQREEITEIMKDCDAVAIAGGHVATLVNRLSLFGIAPLMGGRIVFAWTAGAMAISDRVVLFHDDPPQGQGASEILDAGLGLVPGIVVLPQQEERIHLDRTDRIRIMARRFAPARCLALPARSRITWAPKRGTLRPPSVGTEGEVLPRASSGTLSSPDGVLELLEDGGHGLVGTSKEEL